MTRVVGIVLCRRVALTYRRGKVRKYRLTSSSKQRFFYLYDRLNSDVSNQYHEGTIFSFSILDRR